MCLQGIQCADLQIARAETFGLGSDGSNTPGLAALPTLFHQPDILGLRKNRRDILTAVDDCSQATSLPSDPSQEIKDLVRRNTKWGVFLSNGRSAQLTGSAKVGESVIETKAVLSQFYAYRLECLRNERALLLRRTATNALRLVL